MTEIIQRIKILEQNYNLSFSCLNQLKPLLLSVKCGTTIALPGYVMLPFLVHIIKKQYLALQKQS